MMGSSAEIGQVYFGAQSISLDRGTSLKLKMSVLK